MSDSQFGALAAHYDELMQVVPYDEWADYIFTLFTFANHKPQRVLDCACGTGNVSFELAARGLNVVGVDLSAPMIEEARRKLIRENCEDVVRFVCDDLTTFDLDETFDSATCLYDSFNYILEPAALGAAFARIAAHVERGGVFVFDMNSDYSFRADLFTQANVDPRKKLHYSWHADFDESTRICSVKMRFQRKSGSKKEVFEEVHRERAYTRSEVETLLRAAGWDLEFSFDAYTLNPPHEQSERWFFVARKR